MMNFCRPFARPCLSRMLLRSLVMGTLATVSLLSGLAPDLSGRSGTLVFSFAAYAQEISTEEATNYAQAGMEIEQLRQKAHDDIKNIIGREPPAIVCDKPESLNALTGDARNIAGDYCNRSQEIVKNNHLSIGRFNAITVNLQNDTNLKKRIDNELMRLQNRSR